ncbi:methylated-DNA-[protein]-cysteine S-methyltransferase [Kineococcus xinjiangensis]|uniref:Methylated-DNA-[protein]-cysteine S-methyltransferase n=1 Tax=Kineococcus xinjiangensis TaxID=512762 RepID=A0A2S6IC59_9ACTN|nr:methylated-DNA--[protein]-cysteine S-methyltransferase [Kineococcus xinjiangensis]PPK90816.1 methylated-DNA-[protein]-cysteine S-methyltransferase [Kineococcus xinjiangensis]
MTPPLLSYSLPCPVTALGVLVTPEDGVVRAAGYGPPEEQLQRLAPALRERGTTPGGADDPVAKAVAAYAAGDLTALDAVTVEQPGGPFLQRVWTAMRAVPAGRTATYAQLAAAAGSPTAVRAAGSACARNLLAPFVPCHRILRTGGGLGGYRYGLGVKEELLRHEGTLPPV